MRKAASCVLSGAWVLLSIACAVAGVNLLASVPYRMAGLEVRISARIGLPGLSRLAIPPIGRVEARTHGAPLQLQATLENIDPESLEDAVTRGEVPSSISRRFREDMWRLAARFALKVTLLAGAASALGAGAVSGWRLRRMLGGGLVGLAVSSVVLAGAYLTFDESRLANPRYEGVIEAAPWMLGLLDGSLVEAGETLGSIESITSNIRTVFDRAEAFQGLASGMPHVRLLHVSDIHNNPQAFDFIQQVVRSFQPDLIVDTGDITDFGTVPEAKAAARRIRELGVTYVFVAGNHDSPEVLRVLSSEGGAALLGGGTAAVLNGIRIAGLDDPGGLRSGVSPATDEEMDEAREQVARLVGSAVESGSSSEQTPDVLAVHDSRAAEPALGEVPVVLFGHDHRPSVSERGETVVVDAGTTGGAGIRGLPVEGGVPLSVALLHLEVGGAMGSDVKLVAVDTIRILGEARGFSLERTVADPGSVRDRQD